MGIQVKPEAYEMINGTPPPSTLSQLQHLPQHQLLLLPLLYLQVAPKQSIM